MAALLIPIVKVMLTREEDTALGDDRTDLLNRTKMANDWGADVFVSIHCNAAQDEAAVGTETLFYPGSTRGHTLAEAIQSRLIAVLGTRNRGLKERGKLVV